MPSRKNRGLASTTLKRSFFARPTLRVARDLIGTLLVHRRGRNILSGIVVETEAYTGRRDPGSHARNGLKKGNAPMFGPPGYAYVYKCHMYPLLNTVTEPEGTPGAVLIRAIEPVSGFPRHRMTPRPGITSGPGRLCLALKVDLSFNRMDLVRGALRFTRPPRPSPIRIRRSTRIGLRGRAAALPWRFYASDNPWVSRHPGIALNGDNHRR